MRARISPLGAADALLELLAFDEGVDELEDLALLAGAELLELLEATAAGGGPGALRRGRDTEEGVGGDDEGLGDRREESPGRVVAAAFA